MKVAILSDVHGNLEALTAVIEAVRALDPDMVLSLGDIVGYGADPVDCIEGLRRIGATCLAGNHDYAASGRLDPCDFNDHARQAIEWTTAQLSTEHKSFLASLRLTWSSPPLTAVHATIIEPALFSYVCDITSAGILIQAQPAPLCFCGHSHVPRTWILNNGTVRETAETELTLSPGDRVLINVGSVGQPRDGNPDACFAVMDTTAMTFALKRVPYDVSRAARKILAAGLPELLAHRLAYGF